MKFTIERKALIKLLQMVGKKMPEQKRADKLVKLSACVARVFAESNSTTAGMEALVLEDGSCTLELKTFVAMLKTYQGKDNLTFEAGPNWLKFGSTIMNTVGYCPEAQPPAKFQILPVTDTWVAGEGQRQPQGIRPIR